MEGNALPSDLGHDRLGMGSIPPFTHLVTEEYNASISDGQEKVFSGDTPREENLLEDRNVREETVQRLVERCEHVFSGFVLTSRDPKHKSLQGPRTRFWSSYFRKGFAGRERVCASGWRAS